MDASFLKFRQGCITFTIESTEKHKTDRHEKDFLYRIDTGHADDRLPGAAYTSSVAECGDAGESIGSSNFGTPFFLAALL